MPEDYGFEPLPRDLSNRGRTGPYHPDPDQGIIVRDAGWGWRVAAGLIDYVLPDRVITALFTPFPGLKGLQIWVLLAFITYNSVWRQAKYGQSLGKRLFKMRTVWEVTVDWNYFSVFVLPSVARLALRQVCHIFDLLPFSYGFFRPFFHHKSQTFADSIVHTRVLRNENRVDILTRDEYEREQRNSKGYPQ